MSRTRAFVALGWMFAASLAAWGQASVLLQVDFESYNVGQLNAQSGGTTGGPWYAPPTHGDFRVINAFPGQGTPSLGNHAVTASRSAGGGLTQVDFASWLDTMSPGSHYFAVDFYRGDDNDRGAFYLLNTLSGILTGLGAEIPNGANAEIMYITNHTGTAHSTGYVIQNGKWHRLEWEFTTGPTLSDRTFNLYVQREGVIGRTTLANNVNWDIWNQFVQGFWYYPLGFDESVILFDNVNVESGVSFPVVRPLVVPEPTALGFLSLVGILSLRRRLRA